MVYNNNKTNNSGNGMERFDITIRIIAFIDTAGEVYITCRTGKDARYIWNDFIKEFYKLFQATASLVADAEEDLILLGRIEGSFKGDITLNKKNVNTFLKHFEDYLYALKNHKVYDPIGLQNYYNSEESWKNGT